MQSVAFQAAFNLTSLYHRIGLRSIVIAMRICNEFTQHTFRAIRASWIIFEYFGWLDCFFGFPDDFLFATLAGAAAAASDMMKYLDVDFHEAQTKSQINDNLSQPPTMR